MLIRLEEETVQELYRDVQQLCARNLERALPNFGDKPGGSDICILQQPNADHRSDDNSQVLVIHPGIADSDVLNCCSRTQELNTKSDQSSFKEKGKSEIVTSHAQVECEEKFVESRSFESNSEGGDEEAIDDSLTSPDQNTSTLELEESNGNASEPLLKTIESKGDVYQEENLPIFLDAYQYTQSEEGSHINQEQNNAVRISSPSRVFVTHTQSLSDPDPNFTDT